MANPIVHQNEDAAQGSCLKRRKLENGEAVDDQSGASANKSIINPSIITKDAKLKQFQSIPIEENIDYITLKSSLSLLQSNLSNLEKNIHELSNFKKSIQELDDIKDISRLINKNSNYLNEIEYKGSCIKCPVINWNLNYGLKIEKLDDDECYEKINDEYEILKRDKLFN